MLFSDEYFHVSLVNQVFISFMYWQAAEFYFYMAAFWQYSFLLHQWAASEIFLSSSPVGG